MPAPPSNASTRWRPDEVVGHCGVRIARAAGVDPEFEGLFGGAPPRRGDDAHASSPRRESAPHRGHGHRPARALRGGRDRRQPARRDRARSRAQAAREAADARFRALVQNASDLIITFGPDRRVTYTSPAVTRLLGFGAEELLGMPGVELIDPARARRRWGGSAR